MSQSAFDPNAFLDTTIPGGNETSFSPVPEGVYMAQLSKLTPRQVNTQDGPRTLLDLMWKVDAPEKPEAHERQVKQTLWLDIGPNGLETGKNKNIDLGRVREALGMNSGPANLRQLEGGVARINVKHRIGEGKYAGQIFSEVSSVVKP